MCSFQNPGEYGLLELACGDGEHTKADGGQVETEKDRAEVKEQVAQKRVRDMMDTVWKIEGQTR